MTAADASTNEATAPENLVANAEAYIPGDRRRALAAGIDLPDRVRGAALFADISGFTPLTDVLGKELGRERGAEVLTHHLNRIFHVLISDLDRWGGDVIYFSGDAITCWLDGDDGMRATACALAMQATMGRAGEVVTPAGTRMQLAMKVAVAVGAARRFLVGDPDAQRMDVLAGRLIDELAGAERQAQKGEVVLDRSALESLGERVELRETRMEEEDWREYGVVERLAVGADEPMPRASVNPAALPEDVVREWLLPDVFERLRAGHGEFLAELRPAYPLFLRFRGIDYDYDADDEAAAKLDAFIRSVQRILVSYGGNLLQLTIGDKGAYLYAVFGSPRAHEDDAARAVAAALELRTLQATTAARDIQMGIAYGRLRSGTCGHKQRQAFTCIGEAVNLAARLMAKAPPGRIYVAEDVRRAAGEAFGWQPLPPLAVKGKADRVAAFALAGSKRRASRRRAGYGEPIVGRRAEMDAFAAWLEAALSGRGQVVGIRAEAGMGKSRLAAEFAQVALQRGATVAFGECQPYGAHANYFVWRDVWSTLFHLDDGAPPSEQVAALEAELGAIDPALVPRGPLLSTLLDLPIADNALTSQFDAKLRKTSLEGLLVDCLRSRARAKPLLIVLEDCHWIDALSRDLAETVGRAIASLPVVLVLAYRPAADIDARTGVEKLAHFHELALLELAPEQATELVRTKLALFAGGGAEPPAALVQLVTVKAQGNPFYIEELLDYIRGQGVDPRDAASLERLQLPGSLHSLVLSRIDMLEESPRRTLKVASIQGRVFRATVLSGAYPELGGLREVGGDLERLDAADLVHIDDPIDTAYAFKHVVTQEVAYESMPYAFRSQLHERCGEYLERAESDARERNLALLAHHYARSGNLAKKREYLARAAEAAQAAYANAAAIAYYEQLVPLVEDGERVDVLRKVGKVLELVGDWSRAEKFVTEALGIAQTLGDKLAEARCETALAEVARKQGRFDEAVERLDRAADNFGKLGDDAGVGQVLHLAGTVAAQRGDYAKATENYQASLVIREQLGDKASMAGLLSNLGIVVEYQGDIGAARRYHERALALRTETGDRWAIAVSTNNLGLILAMQECFDEARALLEKSMRLSREVGDGWLLAIGHNNLGNTTRGLGDHAAARMHYRDSLRAYRDFDDRWAMAILLEDIGMLAALEGDMADALLLEGAADALRVAIGAPRAPPQQKEIEDKVLAAASALSEAERTGHRERGRTLDLAAAVELALRYCERSA
ncbi:MAG TPA: tetratricopeptide repeat protein [Casimicrobiaceae bacterium]|nr:tetratricopeptide repeat protein [Casimicrobiaceae bacterium]